MRKLAAFDPCPHGVGLIFETNDVAVGRAGFEVERDYVVSAFQIVLNGVQSAVAIRSGGDLFDHARRARCSPRGESDARRGDFEETVGVIGVGGMPFAEKFLGDAVFCAAHGGGQQDECGDTREDDPNGSG